MFKNTIPAFLLAFGIACAGYSIAQAISQNQAFNRFVTVKGLAEKTVKSDKAVWQLTFSYADDELASAYQGIAKAQNNVSAFLQKQGFASNELELQPVSVVDNDANTYNTNTKGKRYTANAGTTLTTQQVDKVKEAIQQTATLVQNGVLVNNSLVHYSFTELNDIKPKLLDEATANAKAAAEAFARNAQSTLGSIRQANQGLFTISDITDANMNPGTDIMKKVRVVTSVEYFLK
jgi:hypothetical protein